MMKFFFFHVQLQIAAEVLYYPASACKWDIGVYSAEYRMLLSFPHRKLNKIHLPCHWDGLVLKYMNPETLNGNKHNAICMQLYEWYVII